MFKRVIVLLAAAFFAAKAPAGCGNQDKAAPTPAPAPTAAAKPAKLDPYVPGWTLDTSPVTLTWFLDANWYARTWGESAVSKYVTEKTGEKIEFVVPSGDPNEAITLMMASNETMPDIMSVGFWEGNYKKLQESGYVYALNELADKYDPHFYQAVAPELLNWNRLDDGNVYVLPNEAYTEKGMKETGATNANQTFLVRKDLYADLGSPDMRTPTGFLGALQRLHDEFPVYKKEPITPFYAQAAGPNGCYGLEEFLMNFLAIPYEKDGKIYDRYTDGEYIKWLKTLREGVADGIITLEFFVDTGGQFDEKANNARYFCMLNEWTGMAAPNTFLYGNNPEAVYIAVDGPSNAALEPAKLFPGSMTGWLPVMISKDCAKPDRAIRFVTHWASVEGQHDVFLGRKGETWDVIDGKDQILPDVLDMLNTDLNEFETVYGATDTYWMLRDPCVVAQWRPAKIEPVAQNEKWANEHADYSGGMYKLLDPPADAEEGIINSQILSEWGTTLPALLNAATEAEFDTLWKAFVANRSANGFDRLQAYRQNELDKFKAKLG
jgi:putative aldouronate transport system substrate-binding protein